MKDSFPITVKCLLLNSLSFLSQPSDSRLPSQHCLVSHHPRTAFICKGAGPRTEKRGWGKVWASRASCPSWKWSIWAERPPSRLSPSICPSCSSLSQVSSRPCRDRPRRWRRVLEGQKRGLCQCVLFVIQPAEASPTLTVTVSQPPVS